MVRGPDGPAWSTEAAHRTAMRGGGRRAAPGGAAWEPTGCASPPRCAPPPWCTPPSWGTLHPGCAPLAPSLAASEYPDSGPPSHHRHRHRCAHKAKPAGFAALLAGCEQTWDKLPRPRHSETAARKWGKVRLCLAELVLDADVWTLPQHSESALRVYAGQSGAPL